MTYNPGLVGITNTQDAKLRNILLDNMISFYNWGFLDKGGFTNITIPSSGMYGGDKHRLRPLNDPNYLPNQVWQSYRENWAWETGISTSTQPIAISGIYVNNVFKPYTYNSGINKYVGSGYKIDYSNGRVVFDTPIAATSNVTLNYSHKWIKVDQAEGVPFFRQIQFSSFDLDNNFISSSGDWVQLGQTRLQLPVVLIEAVPKRTYEGYQLGGGQWAYSDFVFYVMADRDAIVSDILDTITFQNDRIIQMFNTNTVSKSGAYPVDIQGNLVNKKYNYPHLLENYPYANCRIFNSTISDITQVSYSFYVGTARCSTQVNLTQLT